MLDKREGGHHIPLPGLAVAAEGGGPPRHRGVTEVLVNLARRKSVGGGEEGSCAGGRRLVLYFMLDAGLAWRGKGGGRRAGARSPGVLPRIGARSRSGGERECFYQRFLFPFLFEEKGGISTLQGEIVLLPSPPKGDPFFRRTEEGAGASLSMGREILSDLTRASAKGGGDLLRSLPSSKKRKR